MANKKFVKWNICILCRKKVGPKKKVCVPPHFFNLFDNPFKVPDRFKCSEILRVEKEKLHEDTSKLCKKCFGCGLECESPRYKSGKGGENCKKISIVEKKIVNEILTRWF